jgi:hypothetical protein
MGMAVHLLPTTLPDSRRKKIGIPIDMKYRNANIQGVEQPTARGTTMSSETVKAMKAAVNGDARHPTKDYRRAGNSLTCLVYADAHREAGEEELADLWALVGRFLDVWHENERLFWNYENLNPDEDCPKSAIDRRQMIALDRGTSGHFLVEKATGFVWTIKAYGKKNRVAYANLAEAIAGFEKANAEARERGATDWAERFPH